ncbi:MAG: diversity-generating retroelement protein Avd [Methylococcales bacterium]|nr:diversity-generating retroelement protein Avd [Methylococcales bacterium]MBT7410437.1 diversity-generating retroelement protein Avd [Methylococcales bacterium]
MVYKNNTPKAVQDCHELILWIMIHLDKFPRKRRYTLGSKIENALLEILEYLIQAAFMRQGKKAMLQQANLKLEVIRHLWRLSLESKAIAYKQYDYGLASMNSLGMQIGGWSKAVS